MEEDAREQIVRLLATSVGEAEARAVVEREMTKLGLPNLRSAADVVTLLKSLETHTSAIGLAARLALMRVRRGADIAHSASGAFLFLPAEAAAPSSTTRPTTAKVHHIAEVAAMLARSLGDEAATQLAQEALTRAGVEGPELTREEMGRVFDQLVAKGGAVASVARFCKARLLLTG